MALDHLSEINLRQREAENPDCNMASKTEFVCDITKLLESSNATSEEETAATAVEAVVTCPLGDAGVDLAEVDHRTCGCIAVLTDVGNSSSTRPPRECSCRYCAASEKSASPDLAIDCSSFEKDPYVQGNCKAIACDGTCVEEAEEEYPDNNNNNTTAPTQTPTAATQQPEPATPTQTPTEPPSFNTPTATNATQPPTTAPTITAPPSDNNATSVRPQSTPAPTPTDNTNTTIPCPPSFCPTGKRIPLFNRNIVVDLDRNLTCAELELYSDSDGMADPELCLQLAQYGATCCTEKNNPEANVTTTPQPTPPPTQNGTLWVPIYNSFWLFTTRKQGLLTASVLRHGPERHGLNEAYALFVEQVVEELEGSSTATTQSAANETTRYLRATTNPQQKHRRRLSVTLDTTSAEVYEFMDTDCPTTVPFNSSCAIVFGSFELFLFDEEDPVWIVGHYTNETQKSIDRGLLKDIHQQVDPLSWVTIEGATDDLVPPGNHTGTLGVRNQSPIVIAQEGGYDEYFMVGVGLSVAIIVVCLVAIMCASDWSGMPDDDSVDPWEKEAARSSRHIHSQHSKRSNASANKERAPDNAITDPKTDKQEYLMYRQQVEDLILQKSPEESDNIDELMDLFYQREILLIATLQKMPDCSEHQAEQEEDMMYNNECNKSGTSFFSDSMADWDGGSSDEFAEETRDGSEEESEEAENDYEEDEIQYSTRTIHEGEEGEEDTERAEDDEQVLEESPNPMLTGDGLVMGDAAEDMESDHDENPGTWDDSFAGLVSDAEDWDEKDDSDAGWDVDDDTAELVLEQENNTLVLEHTENMNTMANVEVPVDGENNGGKTGSPPRKIGDETKEEWDDENINNMANVEVPVDGEKVGGKTGSPPPKIGEEAETMNNMANVEVPVDGEYDSGKTGSPPRKIGEETKEEWDDEK